ncbi:hypothetical protein NX801_21990 [Streptomyces sp. LP05-1]|uniref:Lipoprotein n=1 Tax=Streptomyces pyxinae TaxID=2970734 RepID=A0ABT2CLI6_9ACTN|nr:hypothetical protein [Streptomyces sp. LP05-1]MCS0638274.1 hypothetical protein [Streptomyces sp. LP05-1]
MRPTSPLMSLLAVLLLSGCGLPGEEPPGSRVAPPRPPAVDDAGRAVARARSFTAWAEAEAPAEQRGAVVGHVPLLWGDWRTPGELGFLATDHTTRAAAETVARAFAGWGDNAGRPVRAAVYGSGGTLLYAPPET